MNEKNNIFKLANRSIEDNDLKAEIQVAAYFLSKKGISYNDLCWRLAKMELKLQEEGSCTHDETCIKAEEIFNSDLTYDELCWLIAELEILMKKNYFAPNQK